MIVKLNKCLGEDGEFSTQKFVSFIETELEIQQLITAHKVCFSEGILPLESLLKKLKDNGYEGAISIRVRPTELAEGDDEKVVKNLKKAKEFVEGYFN